MLFIVGEGSEGEERYLKALIISWAYSGVGVIKP